MTAIPTWSALGAMLSAKAGKRDLLRGPTSPLARLRLFDVTPDEESRGFKPRVTLYRDNHAWCPYCQKVWFFLEEKRIPYRVEKVTMFCYGDKEKWYTAEVRSGMLPAIKLDGQLITESDDILLCLESAFGPVNGRGMGSDREVMQLRKLERVLFRAWCGWLCYPARNAREEGECKSEFLEVAAAVDSALAKYSNGPYFLGDEFSIADIIFTPYVERMNASLFYYKGFQLRELDGDSAHMNDDAPERTGARSASGSGGGEKKMFPHLSRWFEGMEQRSTYRGTQSDFHTHAHDLPPQMGGCHWPPEQDKGCKEDVQRAIEFAWKVDNAVDYQDTAGGSGMPHFRLPDCGYDEKVYFDTWGFWPREEALERMLLHKDKVIRVNPCKGASEKKLDDALKVALSLMMSDAAAPQIPSSSRDEEVAAGLRYVRDRVNAPRDMSVHAARHFRRALEITARGYSAKGASDTLADIALQHRRDQDPTKFHGAPYKRESSRG